METKDLVLLMLIPIILIILVVYTDKSPAIIGAVTHEPKKVSNIIGTYSIMPSFKAKIDYDLNDYNKIKEEFDVILSCSQSKKIEACIDDINYDNNLFSWSLNCDKGAEKILYDFAEFLQDCFDSEENNCLCKENLELPKEKIQQYELVKQYVLTLMQDIPSQKIEIKMTEPVDLSYSIKLNGRSIWYPNRYVITYTKDDVVLNLFFRDQIDPKIEYKDAFPQKKDVTLYKHEINGLKAVDFVGELNDNLIYPNNNIVIDSDKKSIEIKNLPNCQIKPKNIYKFCVTKKEFKITAYDKLDGQVKERPLTIKFAAYIPPIES